MRTQVAIIGGGPSGLLLSQLLNRAGIDTVILERARRDQVLARVRAGVLEWGTVSLLREAGVGEGIDVNGNPHDGCLLSDDEITVRIDFKGLTGKKVMIYGQTEITADLYRAQDSIGTQIFHEVTDIEFSDLDCDISRVAFSHNGLRKMLECQYVAGCDGFHGVSRNAIPSTILKTFERAYPFGWLGILSNTPPVSTELIYATSKQGFALSSMRSENLSRCYVQVPLADKTTDWSDERFWDVFANRLPSDVALRLTTGPSIEKTIAAVRSFVCEPMQWGNLYLVGDSAHIVPPTGAKGLNLAVSDVRYLFEALLVAFGKTKSKTALDGYSERALARVWKAMRFSNQMTQLLHQVESEDSFAGQMRRAGLQHLASSETARRDFAENYVGPSF